MPKQATTRRNQREARSDTAQLATTHSKLASLVSKIDFIHLKNVSDRENAKKLTQHQHLQDRKLFRLCAKQNKSCSFNPDAVVFNFSKRFVTDKEKEILSKGLNFAIPPTKLNLCGFLTPFEKFYNSLKHDHSATVPDSFLTL